MMLLATFMLGAFIIHSCSTEDIDDEMTILMVVC